MSDLLKNPFALFIAGILGLWLVFKLLNVILSVFWIVVLAFVFMFVFNPGFRDSVRGFFNSIFRS